MDVPNLSSLFHIICSVGCRRERFADRQKSRTLILASTEAPYSEKNGFGFRRCFHSGPLHGAAFAFCLRSGAELPRGHGIQVAR